MLNKIIKVKDRVHKLLIEHAHLRDSDDLLMANIWNIDLKNLGIDPRQISGFKILEMVSKGELTSFSAATRQRRILQKNHPELRGEQYELRHKNEKEIREKISEA